MASQKQIDANRRNAKRSTGPNTATGRAKSRRNAIRDGLTGQITTLSERDRPHFEKLQSELLGALKPQDAMESSLAGAIVWDTWRLNHLRAVETNLYTLGQLEQEDEEAAEAAEFPGDDIPSPEPDDLDIAFADARTYRAESPRFDLMSLYEQRMTRNLHRNVGLLRNLQAERKRHREQDKKDEVLVARVCEFNDLPIKPSTAPSPNGFVFSAEEIAVAAVRSRYVDTAKYVLKSRNPNELYNGLAYGFGDSFLEKKAREEKAPIVPTVHPEILAVDRLKNPEEYGIRQK